MTSHADRVVTALKPAAVDDPAPGQAPTAYQTQIAAIVAEPRPSRPPHAKTPPRLPLVLTASLAACAVAVATVSLPGPGGHAQPARVRTAQPSTSPSVDARTFLLAAAEQAETSRSPASGRYWHLTTRRCAQNMTGPMRAAMGQPSPTSDGPIYHYSTCESEDQWFAANGFVRSNVGVDPKVVFASPQDRKSWQADGSPALLQPPAHTDSHIPPGWGPNHSHPLSLKQLRALPSDPAALKREVAKGAEEPLHGARLDSYIWTFSTDLLAQPITAKTRAGIYRMYAGIPGVRMVGATKDPEGRLAIALSYTLDGSHQEDQILFTPDTHEFLSTIFGGGNSSVIDEQLVAEWTDTLGAPLGRLGHD